MPFHPTRTALLILAFTAPAFSQTAPATAPATASAATRPDDPKSAMIAFFKAVSSADEKAAFDQIYCVNADSQREAQATFGQAFGRQLVYKALNKAFPGADAPSPDMGVAELVKQLDSVTPIVTSDTAELNMSPGRPPISLVKKDGQWKIDFDKTQRANDGPVDPEHIKAAAAEAAVYQSIIADIDAKKFKNADEAVEEMEQRLRNISGQTTSAPATKPGN